VAGVPQAAAANLAAQPTPSASVPMENTSGGQAAASAQGNLYGNSLGQRPGIYITPRAAPLTVAAKPATNSASPAITRNPPGLNVQNEPSSPTRTMATFEPGITSPGPSVNQSSVQSARSTQRTLPSSRSNDPRKRDRQP
jgi:hypothetical protein